MVHRFTAPPASAAAGAVHAKTGTPSDVEALAGYVRDADGKQLAFVEIANHVPPHTKASTEAALDRLAASLARCGCG